MTQKKSDCYWKLGLTISLVIGAVFGSKNCTLAQQSIIPVPDETLGAESSVVKPNVVIDGSPGTLIDNGVRQGTSLFHSFEEFNIGEGQRVYFSNPDGIVNILSRVTGGSRSNILGKLGVSGNANLFLINPKGIVFGPNARLAVNGSFVASTASSLTFADGTQFSAMAPQSSPLLTVSVPIGLQFGESAEGIRIEGSALEVQPGKTLGLVGGDVTLQNALLKAPGGRIELGSVASSSLVSLNPTGWSLGYGGVQNFQNIQLTQGSFNQFASTVNASSDRGGDISLQGRQVLITDNSQILSITNGARPGGNLTVNASESLTIIGNDSVLTTLTTSAGGAGNITINTGRLLIKDGGEVLADSASFEESSEQITTATGRGGNLTVNASESVELINRGSVSSRTQGTGDAGNITIITEKLTVQDGSAVIADTFSESTGKGGSITVKATYLNVVNGSLVSVSSNGLGDAGNLEVTARSIRLENEGKLTATSESGEGGGNISLQNLDSLLLRGNSEISTNAGGEGNGGDITINTNTLTALENSDITANANQGRGGNIRIRTQGLFLSPDSEITAESERGIDGLVEINTLNADPNQGLVNLPEKVVDATGLVARGCPADTDIAGRGGSKFTVTGRGGLPPTPQEALNSDAVLEDWGKIAPTSNKPTTENQGDRTDSTPKTPATPEPFVPATGWVISSNGEVTLTAQAPTVTPQNPSPTPASCNGT